MNVGRNYNGPKVAKYLVGEVPTRTNGVMTGELSRGAARGKNKTREDAGLE